MYKFTGKERDTESNLDSFGARYFASATGRFMTPDWAARPTTVPYAVFGDPQSLNLYTYVRNDPVTQADADGHCTWWGNTCFENNNGDRLGNGDQPANRQAGAVAQSNQAQNNTQTQTQQNQPAPGEAHKGEPTSLQPTGSTPAGNGSKTFTYQVVDPTGNAVRNVSVQEHVKTVFAINDEAQPAKGFVFYPAGVVYDHVGSSTPPGTQHSFLKTEQTFTAMKGGNTYELSTKVNQYVNITTGVRTVQTVVIVP
jgi:RHS repeat-associated protein